jgi:protein TonB
MLAKLLESKAERQRSFLGAMVSVVAHTAVISIAVLATAQARLDEPTAVEIVRWIDPPAAGPPVAAARADQADRPARAALPDLSFLERINIATPSVDPAPEVIPLNSFPLSGGAVISGLTSDHGVGVATTEPLSAHQVDRQASLRPGTPPPRYPDPLRIAGVEGQVVAVFTVNERGRAELGSLRFTRSDNALFEAAVREALATLQFTPAEVGGRKVRQLVQMPFVFRLSR